MISFPIPPLLNNAFQQLRQEIQVYMASGMNDLSGYKRTVVHRKAFFHNENYKHFLRLNNRKSKHTFEDIKHAGYYRVDIGDAYDIPQADIWCCEHCPNRWVRQSLSCWFADEEDAVMFAMRWA